MTSLEGGHVVGGHLLRKSSGAPQQQCVPAELQLGRGTGQSIPQSSELPDCKNCLANCQTNQNEDTHSQGHFSSPGLKGTQQLRCNETSNMEFGDATSSPDLQEELYNELSACNGRTSELAQDLAELRRQLNNVVQQEQEAMEKLREGLTKGYREGRTPDVADNNLLGLVADLSKQHLALQKRFQEEALERRKLHNIVLDMKGSIRVFCRVRPALDPTKETLVTCNDLEKTVTVVSRRLGGDGNLIGRNAAPPVARSNFFTFDSAFGPGASQEEVFRETAPVVCSVLDGYSVCIFAYGQTGSGKTWTMEGSPDGDRGVSFRAVAELFRLAHARRAECDFDVHISMVEVYMEQIHDLLADKESVRLKVKQGLGGSHVPGLTEIRIVGMEQAWTYLKRGQQNRMMAATAMNSCSSRSHCLMCLRVQGRSKLSGDAWRAKLWLCDLAGSERISKSEATGDRMREAQFINKSLSALGDCINALARRASHVPFRNSKLTYLLQESLVRNGKTLMFVNVSPEEGNSTETLCSLQFAARVRGVELGPLKRNIAQGSEIRELKEEISWLKSEVARLEKEKMAKSRQRVETTSLTAQPLRFVRSAASKPPLRDRPALTDKRINKIGTSSTVAELQKRREVRDPAALTATLPGYQKEEATKETSESKVTIIARFPLSCKSSAPFVAPDKKVAAVAAPASLHRGSISALKGFLSYKYMDSSRDMQHRTSENVVPDNLASKQYPPHKANMEGLPKARTGRHDPVKENLQTNNERTLSSEHGKSNGNRCQISQQSSRHDSSLQVKAYMDQFKRFRDARSQAFEARPSRVAKTSKIRHEMNLLLRQSTDLKQKHY